MTDSISELLEPGKLPSELDKDDTFLVLKKWYLDDWKANSPWYSEAQTDYGFESGDQWSTEEKARFEETQRLHVTMNRVKPTVDVICGMEVTNRQEVIYLPRTTSSPLPELDPQTMQPLPKDPTHDDGMVTESYTEIARWARDNCDAEDEESDAFRDTVICGMGWTQTSMDYDDDPEGKIVIDRKDPMEMGWDNTSTKRNLDDARRFHETKRDIPFEVAQAMYPDADAADLHASWAFDARLGEGYEHDRELAKWYANKGVESEIRTKITMVIIEWCEIHTSYEVFNPADGRTFVVDATQFKELSEAAKKEGIEKLTHRAVKKKKWMRAVLGAKILEIGPAPCDTSSSYKCITGYRDRNKHQWYGIVRPMRDPQKWANKFFSIALEQMATSGKGIMAEEGSFVDDKKAEEQWSKTGNIMWMKTGALAGGKVQPKPQPPMLTGLADLMTISLNGIRDVTGVNQETIGMTDRNQAASLEYQRRQAGVTILAAFFDNLRRYRKEQGRVLLYFIQHYISDGRMVRILGENGNPKIIQLIKQPDTVQYDTIVDEAPSSPNQKEAAWMVTQQMLPMVAKMGMPAPVMLEFLKASPLPESSVQRIQRAYTRSQQEQAEQGPSIEEQKLQAEVGKIQADTQKSVMDGQLKSQELQLNKYMADLDAQKTILQLQESAASRDFEMAKMSSEIEARQSEEAMKAFGKDFPQQVQMLMQSQMQLGQALAQSHAQMSEALMSIAQGQQAMAQALMAPKQAVLSPDGNSAVVTPVRMQ